jgi:hypothetical protein
MILRIVDMRAVIPRDYMKPGFEDEWDDDHEYDAHDQNALEGAFSISTSAERCI